MKNLSKIILFTLLSCGVALAGQNYSYDTLPAQSPPKTNIPVHTLKQSIVTVPAGETFRAVFMAPISSETAFTGQQSLLALNTDYYYNGKLVAKAGSAVTGTVIEVAKAKHGSVNGKLTLRYTHLITPDGLDIPISAVIKTDDNSGTLIGGNLTQEAALSQPGKPKRGATISAIAGSGGGLVKSIWDKGNDVDIPVNALIELILTQPITVNPTQI